MLRFILSRFAYTFAGVVFRDLSQVTWEWIKKTHRSRHRYTESVKYHQGKRKRPPGWSMDGPSGWDDVPH